MIQMSQIIDDGHRRRGHPAVPLPDQIGALANGLRPASVSASTRADLRTGLLAATAYMNLGVQTLEFLGRDQLRVGRGLQRSCLNASSSIAGGRWS